MDAKHTLVEGKAGCDFFYLYQCIMGRGKWRSQRMKCRNGTGFGKYCNIIQTQQSGSFILSFWNAFVF